MAYYRKNKRRFDPRYFMNERMEEELEEYVVPTDPGNVGAPKKRKEEEEKPKKEGLSILDLPSVVEEEEKVEEAGRPHSMRYGRTGADLDREAKTRETDPFKKKEEIGDEEEGPIGDEEEEEGYGVEEGCGEPVEDEVDVEELGGDEAFGVGWNAALGEISSIVRELMAEMGAEEDEDADPVGDLAGEALPQMVGEPHLEE
jgi:hypothetical protein